MRPAGRAAERRNLAKATGPKGPGADTNRPRKAEGPNFEGSATAPTPPQGRGGLFTKQDMDDAKERRAAEARAFTARDPRPAAILPGGWVRRWIETGMGEAWFPRVCSVCLGRLCGVFEGKGGVKSGQKGCKRGVFAYL